MARSPFQGTYQPNVRPTVVTAPDAIVYINGEMDVTGCPSCNRTFDLNKYITSIQVDLNIDSVPGSATVALSIPRHTVDDFFFDGRPVITPMMEIEIFAKGYYLVEGVPQYYPIFWGLVTEVTDNYSGGEHTVSINCADILKWWELCRMNINPAYTAPSGQQGRSIFGNVFYGMNPYDVIWSLALQSYGDVVIGTGSLVSLYKEQQQRPTFDAALSDLMLYWEQRFQKIRSNLMLYGINGVAVRGDSLYQFYSRKSKGTPGRPYASSAVRNANGGPDAGQMVFDPTDPSVTAFRTQFTQAGQINFWQSEYQTKLELAHAAKEAAGFEFFMDPSGDIVFKPPFYNLDILANKPVSWIQDIDIIDWGLSESEAEVVTQLTMQGALYGNVDYGFSEELTPFTSVTDYHLLRKYGWRPQSYNSEFLGNEQLMFYHGLDLLDRINSRRHRATVTIPMRSEMRLGFPVYLAPKDQIWYVQGISHNIAFGGRATTSLTLTALREKFKAPRGIASINLKTVTGPQPSAQSVRAKANLSFKYTSRELSARGVFDLKLNNAATLPAASTTVAAGTDNPYEPVILRHPKTGRIVGYPNVVMVYTRPFAPANTDLDTLKGQKAPGTNSNVSQQNEQKLQNVAQQELATLDKATRDLDFDRIKEKYTTNRYQYGLNSAGVYVYAHDSSDEGKGVIGEIVLLPSSNVNVTPSSSDDKLLRGKTSMIRPVSDERGFEVVGHFRYGRRVSLRDGRLVLTGNVNSPANIDMQLALGGGLFETLNAQSQGLTAIASAYSNPADAVARLAPEDLQTAAVINPDGTPGQFTDVGDNFVDAAPLGSPEQEGAIASVEASQLSSALTLAEMSIRQQDQDPDDKCPCLLGRSDLAFINVGYQVRTLNQATQDNTSLFNQSPAFASAQQSAAIGGDRTTAAAVLLGQPVGGSFQTADLENQIAQLQTDIANTQGFIAQAQADLQALKPQGPDDVNVRRAIQYVNDLQVHLEEDQRQLAELQGQLQQVQTQHHTLAPSREEVISRVEQFLTRLYKALDGPHQHFEGAIRGDYLPGGKLSNSPDSFTPNTPPDFAPPFAPNNRAALGDPNAIAGAVNSAENDLQRQWTKFGDQLKAASDKATLSNQISADITQITRLEGQVQTLQKQLSSGTSTSGDPAGQISSLQQQIGQLKQNVANNQAKLATLPK